MNIKKNSFGIATLLISFASFVVLLGGFLWAWQKIVHPKPGQLNVNKEQSVSTYTPQQRPYLLGLGDSLTRGIGDEKGLGYFGLIRNQLQKKMPTLQSSNLAVSGQTSTQLRTQLQQPNSQHLIRQARWILLTIGGNDLNHGSGGIEKLDQKKAAASQKQYIENLTSILKQIEQLNPQANIFLLGLYNPFGDLGQADLSNQIITHWNEAMSRVATSYSRVVFVPTFDLFQLSPSRYLYSDHFHPNHAGYQRIASRLLPVIQDTEQQKG